MFLAVEDLISGEAFEAYVEQVLAGALLPGQIMAADSLTACKGERVKG